MADHAAAVAHLERVDPVLARVIAESGSRTLEQYRDGTHFAYLLRAICFQQLAGAAARTIHGRVLALYGGRSPEPHEVLSTRAAALRKAGLSKPKIAYMRDLAQKSASGELPLHTLDELGDDDVIAALTQVKGIGRWSAHMFLMFRLGRPDVMPELDYGVQKGMQIAYRMRKLPTPKRMQEVTAAWAPHRSVGSWYMWRVLELPSSKSALARRPKTKAKGRAKPKGAKTTKRKTRATAKRRAR